MLKPTRKRRPTNKSIFYLLLAFCLLHSIASSAQQLAVGGTLFRDTNNNGKFDSDSGEAGINGEFGTQAQLWLDNGDEILGSGDRVLETVSVDSEGNYRFTGLMPGEFLVLITKNGFQTGRALNSLRSSTGNDPAPDPDNDADNDDNGVEVSLFGEPFSGVGSRAITLSLEDEPTTDEDADANTNLTLDFGFIPVPTVVLGGTLYRDDNNNGVFESGLGEAGIGGRFGTQAQLWWDNGDGSLGSGDRVLETVSVDSEGDYRFTGLMPGEYLVLVTKNGFQDGRSLNGLRSSTGNDPAPDPDDDVDNDDNGVEVSLFGEPFSGVGSQAITLILNDEPTNDGDANANTNLTVDFGFIQVPTMTLGGTLFRDTNNNGKFESDSGEAGINGEFGTQAQLWLDNGDEILGSGDRVLETVSVDSEGNYRFTGLMPGEFLVLITKNGFQTGRALNSLRSSTGNDPAPDPDNDADNDDNGMEVSLFGEAFSGVGSRAITLSLNNEPTTDGDADANTNLTLDFGFIPVPTVVLGGTLYRDDNNNGIFESGLGEAGIGGGFATQAQLWWDNGDGILGSGDRVMETVSVDSEGDYRFTGLMPGEYLVLVTKNGFQTGRPLNGLVSSSGNDPVPDPDDDVDHDDNGVDVSLFGEPFSGVGSLAVTLSLGDEPANDGDQDPNTNFTVDFGFANPAPATLGLGNLVWGDANGNGFLDQGEYGIGGVEVSLLRDQGDGSFDGNEPITRSIMTDSAGNYHFTSLAQGGYFIRIESTNFQPGSALAGLVSSPGSAEANTDIDNDNNGVDTGSPTQNGVVSAIVTLADGTEPDANLDGDGPDANQTVDFGFTAPEAPKLSLGNLVWNDTNGNGIKDAGETGIPGVFVTLIKDDGDGIRNFSDNLLISVSTDSTGHYRFVGLGAGGYFAHIASWQFNAGAQLEGLVSSPGVAAANDDIDNDDNGEDNEFPLVDGITSTLITLANETEPDTEVDGDGRLGNQTLDFGFTEATAPDLALGNLVWRDENGNGVRDTGEAGIPGVFLTLYKDDGDGIRNFRDTLISSVSTDSAGHYRFVGLAPGEYFAHIASWQFNTGSQLEGLGSSPVTASANDDIDNDDNGEDNEFPLVDGITSTLITLANETEPDTEVDGDGRLGNQTLDFGFTEATAPDLALGNLVWRDENGNGVRDTGEAGIPGVFLTLYKDDGDGIRNFRDTLISSVSTDSTGHYRFGGLPPGEYFAHIASWQFNTGSKLEGLTSSLGVTPADNDTDNDDNGEDQEYPLLEGITSTLITLKNNSEPDEDIDGDGVNGNQTFDFGFVVSSEPHLRLGNQVWRDLDGDGFLDSGEPGIQGVYLTLFKDDGDGVRNFRDRILTSVGTDSSGHYRFVGLPAGGYFVHIASWQFNAGSQLEGLFSSSGVSLADNDFDSDDNGLDAEIPLESGITSTLIYLEMGSEPGVDEDGDDRFGNQTLDFGFSTTFQQGHPPVAVADSYSVNEDSVLSPPSTGVLANDTDADGDTLTAELIKEPEHGTLVLESDGTFTYTPGTNYSGSDNFTYRAKDGNLKSETATVTISVRAVNDPPSISVIADQIINEDGETTALAFSIGDVETTVDALIVSASSANVFLVPDRNIIVEGSGSERTLRVAPSSNKSGIAEIQVSVTDGLATTSRQFVVTVIAVNDAPTLTETADQSIDEDTATELLEFSIGDLETGPDSLGVDVSSSNTTLVPFGNIELEGEGAERTLSVTPSENQFGVTTITITIDDGELSTFASFVLTVDAVNDPPTAHAGADQVVEATTPQRATVILDGSQSTDIDGDMMVFLWTEDGSSVSLGTSAIITEVLGLGSHQVKLTVTDSFNASDSAAIEVIVRDTTPPDTIIQSATDGFGDLIFALDQTVDFRETLSNNLTIQLIGTDAVGVTEFACSLFVWDGNQGQWLSKGPPTSCTSPTVFSDLAIGLYKATIRATDGSGNSDPTSAELIWDVLSPQDGATDLIDVVEFLVNEKVINHGVGSGLISKLEAGIKQLNRQNAEAACNQFSATINQVEALIKSRKISKNLGEQLTGDILKIQSAAGCLD